MPQRPRFGGGRIMEDNTTNPNAFLSFETRKANSSASTMDDLDVRPSFPRTSASKYRHGKMALSGTFLEKGAQSTSCREKMDESAICREKMDESAICREKMDESAICREKVDKSAICREKVDKSAICREKMDESAICREKRDESAICREKRDRLTTCMENMDREAISLMNSCHNTESRMLDETRQVGEAPAQYDLSVRGNLDHNLELSGHMHSHVKAYHSNNGNAKNCVDDDTNLKQSLFHSLSCAQTAEDGASHDLSNNSILGCGTNHASEEENLDIRQGNAIKNTNLLNDCPKKEAVEVERLLAVFENLGIDATPKRYTRATAKDQSSGSEKKRSISFNDTGNSQNQLKSYECHIKEADSSENVVYCKNLFLKDRKAQYYLVIAEESEPIDLKLLKQQLDASRNVSFADAKATEEILGERSGGINPFVAMRESTRCVRFVLHQSLLEAQHSKILLAFHPLDSTQQVEITVDELVAFLNHFGKNLEVLSPGLNVERDVDDCSSPKEPDDSEKKRKGKNKINITKNANERILKNANLPSTQCSKTQLMDPIETAIEDLEMVDNGEGDGEKIADKGGETCCYKNEIDKNDTDDKDETASAYPQENTTSSCPNVKRTSQKEDDSQVQTSTTNINTLNPSINGKPIWKIYSRKGKLKSLLKKNNDASPKHESKPTNGGASNETNDIKSQSQYLNEQDEQTDQNLLQPESVKTKASILPEVTQFYDNLQTINIQYRGIDLREAKSTDIGPSLGCKCFLLKDRRRNFFLVITHEYYELDHGRLKKALKPRKKLDQAEAADIVDALGVQPFRITPFSCTTDRARTHGVQVFFTEKISEPEIILCVQHPFAEGRRLVVKSGELQRFLSTFIAHIGTVEEKLWPDRFNRIFSRFTDGIATLQGQGQVTNNATTHGEESDEEMTTDRDLDTNGDSVSFIESTRRRIKDSSFLCVFLGFIGIRIPPMTRSTGNMDARCIDIEREGSSVDPHTENIIEERQSTREDWPNKLHETENDAQKGINRGNSSETKKQEKAHISNETKHQEGNNKMLAETTSTSTCQNETAVVRSDVMSEREGNAKTTIESDVYHDPYRDERTLLTAEDIICHLREIGLRFVCTRHHDNKCIEHKQNGPLGYEERSSDLSTLISTTHSHNDDLNQIMDEGEEYDNMEICSTTYLTDDEDNHYILVGGESDFIMPKRFRRIFQLSTGRLKQCHVESFDLNTTPFSVAMSIGHSCANSNRKLCVVFFTSIYIDPDTVCVFRLNRNGLSIRMTSSELENYVTKTGMEVWYMP